MSNDISKRISSTALAFRGYNVTNLGKTPELLKHSAYGPTVAQFLKQASEICADVTHCKVDLARRVRKRQNTSLRTYAQAISLVVGTELAQVRLLEEFFGVSLTDVQLAFGYSLGEVAALVAGGVYDMETALTPLLVLAKDAAELASNVTMGVLFSRGPALDCDAVRRLCLEISNCGRGVIGVSSYLSPNTVLLLGQGRTVDRFKRMMHGVLAKPVHIRKNPNRWPPMHTPLVRQRNISNRAGVMLDTAKGGFTAPVPPVLSCVTGDASYNDYNSRELLVRWIDHPQRLWDVIDKVLAAGITTIIHVGPEPNIIPATFNRLCNNVTAQLSGYSLSGFGLRAISHIVRRPRPWLTSLLFSDATLLRAPFVEQIILEDWLLQQQVN